MESVKGSAPIDPSRQPDDIKENTRPANEVQNKIYNLFRAVISFFSGISKSKSSSVKDEQLQTDESAKQVNLSQDGEFKMLGSGANKLVWIPAKPPVLIEGERPKVIYTAVKGFLVDHTKTLKREMELGGQIQDKIVQLSSDDDSGTIFPEGGLDNLALTATLLEGEERVDGQLSYAVDKADMDGEDFIKDGSITFENRVSVGADVLRGFATLNGAGYTYGDPKPENFLVYKNDDGSYQAKIADFGKTTSVKDDDSKDYKGNLRFSPPEGKASTKADSWGAALMLIRNFEEAYLNKGGDPLVNVDEKDFDEKAIDDRRGIEKFIVENKNFMGLDEPTFGDKIFKRLPRQLILSILPSKQKNKQQEAISSYIGALCYKMIQTANTQDQRDSIAEFGSILQDMTQANPDNRITTKQAFDRYKEISDTLGSLNNK